MLWSAGHDELAVRLSLLVLAAHGAVFQAGYWWFVHPVVDLSFRGVSFGAKVLGVSKAKVGPIPLRFGHSDVHR